MASHFLQLNDRISQGEGAPANGDALYTSTSLFPIGAIYIDNNTGILYARNTANGNAADWVSQSGGTTPGIDDVLAEGQAITDQRFINLPNKSVKFQGNDVSIEINDFTKAITIIAGAALFAVQDGQVIVNLSEFADNAAALSGGVPNGGLYYTTQSGERIIKQAHD